MFKSWGNKLFLEDGKCIWMSLFKRYFTSGIGVEGNIITILNDTSTVLGGIGISLILVMRSVEFSTE